MQKTIYSKMARAVHEKIVEMSILYAKPVRFLRMRLFLG